MTHASLFSGIGGPEVAAAMLGWTNLFHCEINPFGRAVLDYHFPESISYEDITKTDFTPWLGRVDVLTGGFPCQPFSYAGKRGGADDDRYLWPEMCRAISECQPTWVVGENVAGLATMVEQGQIVEMGAQATLFGEDNDIRRYRLRETFTIQRICKDLEAIGYSVQPVLIPACSVGAPHRRDRIFIIGYLKNAMHGGQLHRQHEEQGDKRNVRDAGAGDSERLCDGASRTAAANTAGNGLQHDTITGSEATKHREPSGRDTELHLSVETTCGGRSITDSPSDRLEHDMSARRGRNESEREDCGDVYERNTTDTSRNGLAWMLQREEYEDARRTRQTAADTSDTIRSRSPGERWNDFPTVSPVHRGNDGLPFDVDDLTIPFTQWRTESLKAYGNAIVPQVMYEIFRAIEKTDQPEKNMASIQDIHALEQRITDITEEFIRNKNNYTNPQLRVFRKEEGIGLEIIDKLCTVDSAYEKTYSLSRLTHLVPDNDAISDIANEWVFLD